MVRRSFPFFASALHPPSRSRTSSSACTAQSDPALIDPGKPWQNAKRMKIRWKEFVKGILQRAGNVPYVEAAARHILSQRKAPSAPSYETPYEIPGVDLIRPQTSISNGLRLNLFVPSINVSDSFGGIATAVKLFEQLGDIVQTTSDVRLRIITDTRIIDDSVVDLAKWAVLDSNHSDHRYQIVERKDPLKQTIPFSRRDVLVATWWPTAFRAENLRAWQERSFGRPVAPLIYIIQDFEPAFYPWSSWYAYAEGTYTDGANTIAIFNSSLLRTFFEKHGYSFLRTYHFEPRIGTWLKAHLNPSAAKERRIFVYGRPSSPRNCFEVICAGLREWAQSSRGAGRWAIISAGEKHANVPLGNGLEIRSVGKLSLPDYAAMLNQCAVGISLMLSPHPSYPPLEMAHSGILTITNSYGEKNLSSWHENIYSIPRISPEEVAKGVERSINLFEEDNAVGVKGASRVPFYLRDDETEECLYDVARIITTLE